MKIKFINFKMVIKLFLPFIFVTFTNAILQETTYYDGDLIEISLSNYTNASIPKFQKIIISNNSNIAIKIDNIPAFINFIVLQLHTYNYEVSLKYDGIITDANIVNGRNIGLVNFKSKSGVIKNYVENTNNHSVTSMIAVVGYGPNSPIPGGCSMEGQTKIAPYLNIDYNDTVISVFGGPSALQSNITVCDATNGIKHEFYHIFLPEWDFSEETYFANLVKMMSLDGLLKNSFLASESASGPLMMRKFSSYPGIGRAFTVVAKTSDGGYSIYVPAFTYSCNTEFNTDECALKMSTFVKIEIAFLAFLGIFICYNGHRYFMLNLFIMGTIFGTVVSYILLVRNFTNDIDYVMFATSIGIVFGIIWTAIWWFIQKPILSIFIPIFNACFLITCFLFPFPDYGIFAIFNVNFWVTFFSITLVLVFLAITRPHSSSILSSSLVGAYMVIASLAVFVGSTVPYIFINVIRRATIDGFNDADILVPYQVPDVMLWLFSIVLMLFGRFYQLSYAKGRPPFPPVPAILRQDDERTALISETTSPTYTLASETPSLPQI
ncbi:hypothetical protein O3M35_004590 [Rhynocoris fuscipes]|uniref:TM7S3/TM198-like domain-containing protein n=1 Tax=Rhynocoris fuscipes TaxID=488301 RepID=A0AAW1CL78_9HEMI